MMAQASQLQGQFVTLGDTWRNPQFAQFADEFVTTMHVLDNFSRSVEEKVPYLREHARLLEDVIRHRHPR